MLNSVEYTYSLVLGLSHHGYILENMFNPPPIQKFTQYSHIRHHPHSDVTSGTVCNIQSRQQFKRIFQLLIDILRVGLRLIQACPRNLRQPVWLESPARDKFGLP